jgi:hypothetical protein
MTTKQQTPFTKFNNFITPPRTVQLFPNTTGSTKRGRRTNGSSSSPMTKYLRGDAEELIIYDYNPENINKDGELMDINKINDVKEVDKNKYLFYPSSFAFKKKVDDSFTMLCIHKFNHNNPITLKTPLSYKLHPNVIGLLDNHALTDEDKKNIESAFNSLQQGQTLLINLNSPITLESISSNNTNNNKGNFTIQRTTQVNIDDVNSVIIYNSNINYSRNNKNRNVLIAPRFNNPENESNNNTSGMVIPTEGNVNNTDVWNITAMQTPPGASAHEAAPNTPTQILQEPDAPTQIINPSPEPDAPTQIINPSPEPDAPTQIVNPSPEPDVPTQIVNPELANTQMFGGKHSGKKNKKASKKNKKKINKKKTSKKNISKKKTSKKKTSKKKTSKKNISKNRKTKKSLSK